MCLVGGHAGPPLQRVTRVIAIRLALSTTDAQWCHSVTCPVGTHDLCARPRQRLLHHKYCDVVIVTTTDAQIVRPYTGLHVSSLYVLLCQQRTPSDSTLAVRPYRATSCFDPTGTLRLDIIVRPYTNRHVMWWGISVFVTFALDS